MTKDDFRKFGAAWMTAHAVFGSEPSAAALQLCYRALECYSIDDIENALAAHMRDPEAGRFAPKPADIVRAIDGATESRAMVAWTEFREATRTGKAPADPVVQAVVKRMGGLPYLGDKTSRELDFMLPQFKTLYAAAVEPQRLGLAAAARQALAHTGRPS